MITKTTDALPPLGQYVLVHMPNSPWLDSDDQEGVFWVVAKRVANHSSIRGNNQRDYHYQPFSPTSFFGQEVTEWAPLPHRDTGERDKIARYLECEATDWEYDIAGHKPRRGSVKP